MALARPWTIAFAIALMSALTGCPSTELVSKGELPQGLQPLADNPLMTPMSTDEHIEVMVERTAGGGRRAFGLGVIHAPLSDVRSAMMRPNVVVNRRRVDEFETVEDYEPEYEHSFLVKNTVNSIITVRFHLAWRFGDDLNKSGTSFAARWHIVEGPEFIKANQGSVVLVELDDNLTLVDVVYDLNAIRTSDSDLETYLRDLHASVAAEARGETLPTF